MKAEAGDKVRLKSGEYAGQRGVVKAIDGGKLMIHLESSERKVRVTVDQVTNYSLAARKAWMTHPDRAVGRRKGTKLTDRVSVTLRFDRVVWQQFLDLEESGVIENRTGLINEWFRDNLEKLAGDGRADAQKGDI